MAAWLSGLDGERLERVLVARPDGVAAPEPQSLGEVADRLRRQASVARVLPRLTLPCLQATEALAALGTASRAELAYLLGVSGADGVRGLDEALGGLAELALVWPDGDGQLCMAEPLRLAWHTPLGLDAPLVELLADTASEELRRMLVALGVKSPGTTRRQRLSALVGHHSDPEQVTALVAGAPAATRKLLGRLALRGSERAAQEDEFGEIHAGSPPGARWALERGLLVQDRYGYVPARMPAEVAFALRGDDWHAPFDPVPPSVSSAPVTSEDVDREASAAATAFAADAASVLAVCSASPPAVLKSGGVGARELARIGKAARCDDGVVRLVLETAHAAGLLAADGDRVAATDGYDAWAEREPAERFAVLLQAWRELPFAPSQARGEDGKALPVLAGTPPCVACAQARDGLLIAAAILPAGRGAENAAELGPLIAWHRPLAEELHRDAVPFATHVREAELLGVIARGALSRIGAAAREHDAKALAAACRRLLPAAAKTARFGTDLTAVVTGTPSASLAALLDATADREAGGTASVWRFGPGTVRRALDSGRTPEAIVADLAAVAVGALPQPLSYLVHDTARGHGRMRVTTAACVIHGEEPALLAELAAHRQLTGLGLRRLAPTVLVGRSPLDDTLAALRAAGYAPVAEAADGTVRVEKPQHRRAAAPVPRPRQPERASGGRATNARKKKKSRGAADAPDVGALAAKLLAAPPIAPEPDPENGIPYNTDVEEITAYYARLLPLADIRQLAHAISKRQAITIEYVDASGNYTVRTISEIDLDAPYIYAWCHLRDDDRVFTLSRVHGVMPA
ncbi:helicase-associated domain-containing protein [Streptomyces sp. NPDC050610]|uniref:helicase C-terminal domain-containing protein n=1 Tax=Streptomyces sp. NPDC050610 TaxID=3157097 RepID=UPI003428C053